MSDEIKALVERASRLLPVVVNITQDYAELSFGDAHPTQAMTMQPDDWLALNDIASALTAQADEIERLNAIARRYMEKVQGKIVVLSTGEHSMYIESDPYVLLEEVDFEALYKEEVAKTISKYSWEFNLIEFAEKLVKEGKLARTNYEHIHLGN